MKNFVLRYKAFVIITGLFLISVIIRIPSLNRDLALHHEWGTAHLLITLQIWEENGISIYNYNPVFTFNNIGDKFPSDLGKLADEYNNYYYVSYPPFAFYFPYLVFKLLKIYPDVLPIRILNIFLHFLSSIVIYILICKICIQPIINKLFVPALLSSCIYIFIPSNLWYLCSVFSVEIFSQTIFLLTLLSASFVLFDNKNLITNIYLLLGSIILLALTEYIGYLFILLLLMTISLNRKFVNRKLLLGGIVLSGFIALSIFIILSIKICGINCFLENLINRYGFRSGATEQSELALTFYNPDSYIRIFTSYIWEYSLPFGVFFGLNILTYIYFYRKSSNLRFNYIEKIILLLSWATVLLHHLVLFGFTAMQSFAVVKTSIPLVLTLGLIINKLYSNFTKHNIRYYVALTSIFILFFIYHYYKINFRDYINPKYKEIGIKISENNNSDEVVFVTGIDAEHLICPQTNFYARRNVAYCKDMNDAISKLQSFKISKGVIFNINENREIVNINRISL